MKTKIILLSLSLFISTNLMSQDGGKKEGNGKNLFDQIYNSYSGKKLSIVVLKNGDRIEGYKKDVDRKKGQIYYIKIKDEKTGKKLKFDSDEIKEMYLYPGGLEKLGKISRYISDTRQWERSDLDSDVINKGYIYFKTQMVSLKNKKKKKEYMMQLVNPTFSSHIEIFGDPFAKETFRLGIAGLNIAGGLAKSYYVKKNGEIFWLRKKELEVRYHTMFGDCKEFVEKYPKEKIEWRYFSEYVFEYTKMKSKKTNKTS
jgi:hypothetical protein